jgi:capsular exopolysaccharide synthesis family protein
VTAYEYGGDAGAREQSELGLRHYLDVVRRRRWTVLAVLAAALAAAVAISQAQAKTYQATTKIVVGQGNGLIPAPYAGAVQPYTATMADLVKSDIVARTVIQRLGLRTSPDKLLEKVSVSINPTTSVMTVHVKDHRAVRAVEIARNVASVFAGLVRTQFGSKPVTVAPGTTQLPLSATVFDPAHADPEAVSPRPLRDTILGVVIGLVLGLVAAFLREHFDRRLRTREAVEAAFGVPVIGQVPTLDDNTATGTFAPGGRVPEAVRALRANLEYLAIRRPLRTILITSASPQQGKTTVTAYLAVALARAGAATVAVEADLRRPRLGDAFGTPPVGPGLSGAIVGASDVDSATIELRAPEGGDVGRGEPGRLAFLPSGPLPPNPSELVSSDQMTRLLERLGVMFDHVLVDSPPILLVADSLELARSVDGVIVVARRNSATKDEAHEVRKLVERLGVNLLGVVFTDVRQGAHGYDSYVRRRTHAGDTPAAARELEPVEHR